MALSLRSRGLEVVGTRKNGRARRRHARGEGALARKAPENRLSPSCAPVLSFAHFFQAPATQAKWHFESVVTWQNVSFKIRITWHNFSRVAKLTCPRFNQILKNWTNGIKFKSLPVLGKRCFFKFEKKKKKKRFLELFLSCMWLFSRAVAPLWISGCYDKLQIWI